MTMLFQSIVILALSTLPWRISAVQNSPPSHEGLDVMKLHKLEKHLLEPLENYISEMEDNLHILEELKHHTDLGITQARESQTKYIGNPVNLFLLIKRFTGSWAKVGDFIQSENPAPGFLREFKMVEREIPRTGLLLKALDELEQPEHRTQHAQHDLL